MSDLPPPELVIAIDGPAGAGKSTVARLLALRLGLQILDTGAMYRALALFVLKHGLAIDDADGLGRFASDMIITFPESSPDRVHVNGEDVADEIRTLEIGEVASQISVYKAVRDQLVALQQGVIARGGYVLEGRDVTTVVAPNADLKVFLTASIEERARRRWLEIVARGEVETLQKVVKDVVIRDHRDYTRPDGTLMLAEDAVIVESFGLSPDEVVEQIVALIPA